MTFVSRINGEIIEDLTFLEYLKYQKDDIYWLVLLTLYTWKEKLYDKLGLQYEEYQRVV